MIDHIKEMYSQMARLIAVDINSRQPFGSEQVDEEDVISLLELGDFEEAEAA